MKPLSKKYLYIVIATACICVLCICLSFTDENSQKINNEIYESSINLDDEIKKASDEAVSVLNSHSRELASADTDADKDPDTNLPDYDNDYLNKNYQSDEDFYKSYTKYREKNNLLDRNESNLESNPYTFKGENGSVSDPYNAFSENELKAYSPLKNDEEENSEANVVTALARRDNSKRDSEIKAKRQNDFTRALGAKSSVYTSNTPLQKDKEAKASSSSDSANYLDNQYSVFKNNDYVLNNKVEALKSPFALMQGSILKARLITGINSELPGQITAQITTDVYDSIKGRYLLIPRGTKVIGMYSTNNNMNAKRVFLGFSRLIFPNGSSLNIGAMPGQSLDGYAGLDAKVETHFFKNLLSSFLISTISTTRDIGSDTSLLKHDDDYFAKKERNNFLDNLTDASNKTLSQNINLSPTLNVEPGFLFSIAISKDIYFNSPYRR